MFLFSKPTERQIRRFLDDCQEDVFSYPSYAETGASRREAPPGYTVDHNRFLLGYGGTCFERAVGCLRRWKMFEVGWTELLDPGTAIEVGATVGILVRHFGFYSLNAARVVYCFDEEREGIHRTGFSYGTLREHAEQGEERFSIEWNRRDDRVTYDLFAFSLPRHVLARLGYPISRGLQKRFARDSGAAMIRAAR